MKYQIIIEPSAERDIEESYFWGCDVWGVPQAQAWYDGLMKAIHTLSKMPKREQIAAESKSFDAEVRQMIYGKGSNKYRVLFTIKGKMVYILHVRRSGPPIEP